MTNRPHQPEVLFVCVHNAGRSQMAAALLDHHAAGRITVRSAGSQPAHRLNPATRLSCGPDGYVSSGPRSIVDSCTFPTKVPRAEDRSNSSHRGTPT